MAAFLEQAFCYLEAKGNSLETYLPQQKKKERDAVANIIDHSKKNKAKFRIGGNLCQFIIVEGILPKHTS